MLATETKTDPFCQVGKNVIQSEIQAIQALIPRIGAPFAKACQMILSCEGRTIVLGMGKSGHIGRKIAATLASTGTPSFFVHPSEASHGDMGMITNQDTILAISNSGETPELINIIPPIKRFGLPLIAMSGNPESTLSRAADIHLDISVKQEACFLGLAPTSSTTATLVMGDALAIALIEARGFTSKDFAQFHPGGSLGRRLLLRAQDIMYIGEEIPIVHKNCLLDEALMEITQKSLGMTAIIDDDGLLTGIFTDGDLRRTLDHGYNIHTTKINKVMTHDCITIEPKLLAVEALSIMQNNKITSLLVIDEDRRPIGVVRMQELIRAGVI